MRWRGSTVQVLKLMSELSSSNLTGSLIKNENWTFLFVCKLLSNFCFDNRLKIGKLGSKQWGRGQTLTMWHTEMSKVLLTVTSLAHTLKLRKCGPEDEQPFGKIENSLNNFSWKEAHPNISIILTHFYFPSIKHSLMCQTMVSWICSKTAFCMYSSPILGKKTTWCAGLITASYNSSCKTH